MQNFNLNYSLTPSILSHFTNFDKNTLIKTIIEAENKFDPKYKTELCQKFQTTGKCPYGYKCRFAHGKKELLRKNKSKNYKKLPCKTFYQKGYCPYGSRCNFRHNEKHFSDINFSYYYFQLFLLKKFFDDKTKIFLHSIGSRLIYDRLPVFKSITENLENNKNNMNNMNDICEFSKDGYFQINFERKNSQSTVSNTSYGEDKKIIYNVNKIVSHNY